MPTIHFIGINGKGVRQVLNFFNDLNNLLPAPVLKFTGTDITDIQDKEVSNVLRDFIQDKNLTQKDITNFFKKHQPDLIVTTPAALNFKNLFILIAQKLKIPIIEFSDVIRFLQDTFLEKTQPNLMEYNLLDLTPLEKLFKTLPKKAIIKAIKKSKLLPFYFEDLSGFTLYGITGTDGKTTTSSIIYHILKNLHIPVGMITTIEAKFFDGKKEISATTGLHTTTPDAQKLKEFIHQAKKLGVKHLILETTSHGLIQMRIAGIKFDIAIITNLGKEHLDYHKTVKRYHFAKSLLASKYLKDTGKIITTKEVLKRLLEINPKVKEKATRLVKVDLTPKKASTRDKTEYSLISTYIKREIFSTPKKISARLHFNVKLPNYGIKQHTYINALSRFFIENASFSILATIETLKNTIKPAKIISPLKTYKLPTGREQVLAKNPLVIVDFAHTPLALKHILKELLLLKKELGYKKILVVFGTAGERDKKKRAPMGKIAHKYADIIILTAEDPRREDLFKINQDIIKGMKESGQSRVVEKTSTYHKYEIGGKTVYSFFEHSPKSREDAIKIALKLANPDDIILITGKGHEQSLAFATKTGGIKEYPWDDVKVSQKLLQQDQSTFI